LPSLAEGAASMSAHPVYFLKLAEEHLLFNYGIDFLFEVSLLLILGNMLFIFYFYCIFYFIF